MYVENIEQFKDMILEKPENYAYFGDLDPDVWGRLGFVGQHRDSETIDRSNFEVARMHLENLVPDAMTVESSSHWVVGWSEVIRIDTTNEKALEAAYELYNDLMDYPLLDEDHHTELEEQEIEELYNSYGKDEVIEDLLANENPLGLLDDDGDPVDEYDHYLFFLFRDLYHGNSFEGALDDIRYQMRYVFEQHQPPLQNLD